MSSLSKGLLGDSEETPQARLERASWHVQDAMHGMERTMPRRTRLSRHAAAVKLYLNPLLPWLAFALLVLSAFEPPYWCRKIELATHGDARLCGHPNYPSWMLSPPSPFIANAIESVVLLLFLLNVVLSTIRYGVTRAGVAADPNRAVNAVIVTAAICDALFPLAVPHATPYFRAALQVTHSIPVRQQLAVIWRASLRCYGAASLMAVYVCYCGWLSTIIFPAGTPEAKEVLLDPVEVSWQLLILITTANFPDVMMPGYTDRRVSALFFCTFVLLGVFFLSNYLLATVWGSHKAQDQYLLSSRLAARRRCLNAAFECLNWEGNEALSQLRMEALLDRLPASISGGVEQWGLGPSALAGVARHLKDDLASASANCTRTDLHPSVRMSRRLLFAVLDASGDGKVARDEFMFLCDVLSLRFKQVVPSPPVAQRLATRCNGYGSNFCLLMTRVLEDPKFEYAVDVFLVASSALLLFEHSSGTLSVATVVFTLLFTLEVVLKLLFLPLRIYLRTLGVRLDVLASILSVGLMVYVSMPDGYDDGSAVHAVLALRLLRLIRLFVKLPAYHEIFATFLRLLPAASTLTAAFGLIIFIFASLGMQVFGGIITTDMTSGRVITPEQARALADSDFGKSDYYPNSFNDLPSGFITLFELLVVNNWQVITSGYTAVLGNYARWYFILFWAVGVVVMLNVMVAFVLESYEAYGGFDASEQVLDYGPILKHDRVVVNAHHLAQNAPPPEDLHEGDGQRGGEIKGTFEVRLHQLPLRKRKAWRQILIKLFDKRRASAMSQVTLQRAKSSGLTQTSFRSLVDTVLSANPSTKKWLSGGNISPESSTDSRRYSLPLHLLGAGINDEGEGGGASRRI